MSVCQTAVPSRDEGMRIARSAVDARFAACAQVVGPITNHVSVSRRKVLPAEAQRYPISVRRGWSAGGRRSWCVANRWSGAQLTASGNLREVLRHDRLALQAVVPAENRDARVWCRPRPGMSALRSGHGITCNRVGAYLFYSSRYGR